MNREEPVSMYSPLNEISEWFIHRDGEKSISVMLWICSFRRVPRSAISRTLRTTLVMKTGGCYGGSKRGRLTQTSCSGILMRYNLLKTSMQCIYKLLCAPIFPIDLILRKTSDQPLTPPQSTDRCKPQHSRHNPTSPRYKRFFFSPYIQTHTSAQLH